ncbi:MAG: nucleotidyltransferase family protein, partial [Lachnospiraceae bacterium]|nr:nucleotidyltransferase family protein [Lachnospiraceae bacterium]
PSATALRAYWESGSKDPLSPAYFMPEAAYKIFAGEYARRAFVTETSLSPLLALKLLQLKDATELSVYADMGVALANRVFARRYADIDFPLFSISLKTRELTLTRIKRALLHTVLGITAREQEEFRALKHSPYVRILGMGASARPFLRSLKEDNGARGCPPLILKPARAKKLLTPGAYSFFQKDIACAELYRQLSFQNGGAFRNEFTHEIIHPE